MLDRSTENCFKETKFNRARQQRNRADALSIRTPSMWLNLLIAVIWLTCIIENALVSGTEAETDPNVDSGEAVCTSEACKMAAARIKSWMSEGDDPCDDFYQFACGGFSNGNESRDDHVIRKYDEMNNKMKNLLESNDVTTPDPRINELLTNMRKHYNDCVNFDPVDNDTDIVKHFLSELPLPYINPTKWESIELEGFLAELQTLSFHFLVKTTAEENVHNTTTTLLTIDQPTVRHRYRLLKNHPPNSRLARKSAISKVLKQVYNDLNIDNVAFDADAILNLELLIANATIERASKNCCPTDNELTVSHSEPKMSYMPIDQPSDPDRNNPQEDSLPSIPLSGKSSPADVFKTLTGTIKSRQKNDATKKKTDSQLESKTSKTDQPSVPDRNNPSKFRLTGQSTFDQLMKKVMEKMMKNINRKVKAIKSLNGTVQPQKKNDATKKSASQNCCPTVNRWTVSQLQSKMSNFNWRKYLDQLTAHQNPPRTISNDWILTVKQPDYFQNLDKILENENMKLTFGLLATFLLMEKFQSDLPEVYRDIFESMTKEIYSYAFKFPRHCHRKIMDESFADVASRIYSQEYFDQAEKTAASKMVPYIKRAFHKRLRENTWIDKHGRDFIDKKARQMTEIIGYYDRIYNTDIMVKDYGWKTVSGKGYLPDKINMIKGDRVREIESLWLSNVDIHVKNKESAIQYNAFYSPEYNRIWMTMGFFAPPRYHNGYPNYLNYGGLGHVFTHEMIHAFGRNGLRFDELGNRKFWISKEDKKFKASFEAAAQCLIDQYNAMEWNNQTIDGNESLEENIPDNAAIIITFEAYKEWVKSRGKPELKLPGLNYTSEQLYFINFGQGYCGEVDSESAFEENHLPGFFRVNGALSNSPNFQETFQCRPEDKMNAATKCSVW